MIRETNKNIDIKSVHLKELNLNSEKLEELEKEEEKKIENTLSNFEKNHLDTLNSYIEFFEDFKKKNKELDVEDNQFKDKRRNFNKFVETFLNQLEEGFELKNISTKNDLLLTKIHIIQSLLTRIYNRYNHNKTSAAQKKILDDQQKIEELKKEIEVLKTGYDEQIKEISSTKKELVAIMGLFIGIFSFFQLNFSQIPVVKEFISRDKILYLLVFNVILLTGIYFIFSLMGYLIYKNFEMLSKPFEFGKFKIKIIFVIIGVSIAITILSLYYMSSPTGEKSLNIRIQELEKKIENLSVKDDKNSTCSVIIN